MNDPSGLRRSWLVAALAGVLIGTPARASATPAGAPSQRELPQLSDGRGQPVLHGAGLRSAAKACTDTVFLYGGPGSLLGKFQTATMQPDPQGWTGVDLTEVHPHWHVSTFNAANLGVAPPYWIGAYTSPLLNHAMWDGVPPGTPGFAAAPGYGNNWLDLLDRRFVVTNPAAPTTLTWDFVFNHDTEPGYDYFTVEWDRAGSMLELAAFENISTDSSGNWAAVTFSSTVTYQPGDYVGTSGDQVHIRLKFDSDGGWSDEDGLWVTDGAVQVDNIQVNGSNGLGLSQATFEGGQDGGWQPVPSDFVGDFLKIVTGLQDLDPCRDNNTPQLTFIDNGTPPNNDPLQRSTGGSTSPTWTYGMPGSWVVNYTGGLTLGLAALSNEVWSPEIPWDMPGTCDDVVDGGAFLRYSVWEHMPVVAGIFHVWHLRSFPEPDTGDWSGWEDRAFVYYSESPLWTNRQLSVRDLLVNAPQKVQIALGVLDLAELFAFAGNDATPAPWLDNVGLAKYDTPGPGITTRTIDIFQDGFAESGAAGCAAPLGDYAIRVDMARDIRPAVSPGACAGDSLIADFVPRRAGATLDTTSIFLEFVLQTQPIDHFATARAAALAALGATQIGADRWSGQVAGRRARTSSGAIVQHRWTFDLPDGATTNASYQLPEDPLFFSGDQLRYFLRASTLDPAETSLLPADTTGFTSGDGYSRIFTIGGLPTLTFSGPSTCAQPAILVWNDLEHRGGEDELLQTFHQNGLIERTAFDVYTTKGPTSLVSNGLGGVHGANAMQLSGYGCLFYEAGDLSSGLISDGSGSGTNDKGDDVGVLTAWMGQAADRFAAYWGDGIAVGMTGGAATYRSNIMNTSLVGDDVRSSIGDQTAPRVAPTVAGASLGFVTRYVAYGGCLAINRFDNVDPGVGAVRAHEFLRADGTAGVYPPSASVYYARQDTIAAQAYDRVNVTFPYGLCYIQDVLGAENQGGDRSARANLVRELLIAFGHGGDLDQDVVGVGGMLGRQLLLAQNRPNPFNPSTEIAFTAPAQGKVLVRIFDLRGKLVTTLWDDVVEAGQRSVLWTGVDARGRAVASGVYLYQVDGFGQSITRKMALVK